VGEAREQHPLRQEHRREQRVDAELGPRELHAVLGQRPRAQQPDDEDQQAQPRRAAQAVQPRDPGQHRHDRAGGEQGRGQQHGHARDQPQAPVVAHGQRERGQQQGQLQRLLGLGGDPHQAVGEAPLDRAEHEQRDDDGEPPQGRAAGQAELLQRR
jgi:hypothetical protein